MGKLALFEELRRRDVPRAGVLYAGSIRALAQGIAQLGPSFDAPDWITRWFVIAGVIGFPFWLAFAWFHEFTPSGLKRESAIDPGDSIAHSTSRKLDFWIMGIMAAAIVLLTSQLVRRHDAIGVTNGHADAPRHWPTSRKNQSPCCRWSTAAATRTSSLHSGRTELGHAPFEPEPASPKT